MSNKLYLGSSEVNLEYDAKYKSTAPRRESTGIRSLEEAGRHVDCASGKIPSLQYFKQRFGK
jgi:hypothetical protein